MKCVFCIQILGGVALGSLAISILILNLRTLDFFFFNVQKTNWTVISKRYHRMIVTVSITETFVIQLWSLLLMLTMFESSLMKKLNLITLNLLGASFDACYRLYCQMYGVNVKSWMSYPPNCLFVLLLASTHWQRNSKEQRRKQKNQENDQGNGLVFRFMQAVADLFEIKLFTLLSFAHGAIDLLERLSASMFGTLFTRSSKETRGKPF